MPLVLGAQMWEFAAVRLDDHAFPDEPGSTRLRVDLTDMEVLGADAQFEITEEHLDRYIERLVIERNRMRFLSAPAAVAS